MGNYNVKLINKSSQRIKIVPIDQIATDEYAVIRYCDPGESTTFDYRYHGARYLLGAINPRAWRNLAARRVTNRHGLKMTACSNGCCLTITDNSRSFIKILNKLNETITAYDMEEKVITVPSKSCRLELGYLFMMFLDGKININEKTVDGIFESGNTRVIIEEKENIIGNGDDGKLYCTEVTFEHISESKEISVIT